LPLGSMVGIIGAPSSIHASDDLGTSSWTVCDTTQTPKLTEPSGQMSVETTVLANNPVLDDDIRVAGPEDMILTQYRGTVFLIYQGMRAPIDVSSPALFSALHLNGSTVREVSPGLLNSFPLVEPIVPVNIPGVGEDASYLGPGYRVGSMLKTSD